MKNLFLLITFCLLSVFYSCSKDDAESPTSRNVKYEITGNFTGDFIVVYTNASGATENVNIQSLPWTKEITLQNNVKGVGFSANGLTSPGKTSTSNLYVGGSLKQTANQTSSADGVIIFGTLSYVFN